MKRSNACFTYAAKKTDTYDNHDGGVSLFLDSQSYVKVYVNSKKPVQQHFVL